jgi:hypothetical protein
MTSIFERLATDHPLLDHKIRVLTEIGEHVGTLVGVDYEGGFALRSDDGSLKYYCSALEITKEE